MLQRYTKGITSTAASIVEMKAMYAGTPETGVAPTFVKNADLLDRLRKAERLTKHGGAPGPDHYDTNYSVFGTQEG